jgi:hypothetical protein
MRPPPKPSPFRISVGRFAQRATTGYPVAVPKLDSFVLSAYNIKARTWPPSGICDCQSNASDRYFGAHKIDLHIPEHPRTHPKSKAHEKRE